MKKKEGVFDKAKAKSGVIEGGINELVNKIKKDDLKSTDHSVRISIIIPEKIRKEYKAFLAKKGISITEHILSYIQKTLENQDK